MSDQQMKQLIDSVVHENLSKPMCSGIMGPQWGDIPTDLELGIGEECVPFLCTDECQDEQTISAVMDEIIEKIEKQALITTQEVVEEPHPYTLKYGIEPERWYDESGALTAEVFTSNSEKTRSIWGTSLTIRYDESSDEDSSDEEYDQGDMDDYRNERQYYFH